MEKRKAKYNMWQMTAYMLKRAACGHKWVIILGILIAINNTALATVQMLVSPVILGNIEQHAPISRLILSILVFTFLLFALTGLKGYFQDAVIAPRIALRTDIVQDIADKKGYTSYCNIYEDEFLKAGKAAHKETQQNSSSTEAIWTALSDMLSDLLGIMVYLFIVSSLHPALVLIVSAFTILEFFINKKIGEAEYAYKDEINQYEREVYYLGGILASRRYGKDLRLFGLHRWLCDVRENVYQTLHVLNIKKERKLFLTNVVGLLATLFRNGIAYAYLIYLVLQGKMIAATFLLYLGAIGGFTAWITGLLRDLLDIHKKSLGLSIVREFLEWPEKYQFNDGAVLNIRKDAPVKIELKNVSYHYPGADKNIISNMNLTINPEENVAIVGLNGAGKTTLVRLITGLLDPTEGVVLLNGEDIRKYNRNDYYKIFAAVFQDFSVLESSIYENVSQTTYAYDKDKVRKCLDEAGILDKVDSLSKGGDSIIGKQVFDDGIELSGGEIQRLMLARALYKEGNVLVLDEPTAALDPIAENDIYMKYSEMTKGKTSIFISHRLASTRFCNRIILMNNGKIKEEGTHDELINLSGEYAHLFEVQSKYYKEGGAEYEEELKEAI
jgi:ATP-binding cassette subfamily B protein